MFKVELLSIVKDYEGFWFSILSVDTHGDMPRSFFAIGKEYDIWYFDLFFVKIAPR